MSMEGLLVEQNSAQGLRYQDCPPAQGHGGGHPVGNREIDPEAPVPSEFVPFSVFSLLSFPIGGCHFWGTSGNPQSC